MVKGLMRSSPIAMLLQGGLKESCVSRAGGEGTGGQRHTAPVGGPLWQRVTPQVRVCGGSCLRQMAPKAVA